MEKNKTIPSRMEWNGIENVGAESNRKSDDTFTTNVGAAEELRRGR